MSLGPLAHNEVAHTAKQGQIPWADVIYVSLKVINNTNRQLSWSKQQAGQD